MRPKNLLLLIIITFLLLDAACISRQSQQEAAADVNVTLEPLSTNVGETTLLITVTDSNGEPINDATVAVKGDMTHAGMQPVLAEAAAGEAGVYTIPFEWTMGGDWIVTVDVTLADGTVVSKQFSDISIAGETTEMDHSEHVEETAEVDHSGHESETAAGEHAHEAAAESSETIIISDANQQMQVAVATYLMDNAGFHAMDERFNEEGGAVMTEDAAVVTHISNVLTRTEWPADLQSQVDELVAVLVEYAAVLTEGDATAAAPLAAEAHTLQHELSQTVESIMTAMTATADHDMAMMLDPEASMFPVAAAQLAMDSAGFHALDERLNVEGGATMPDDALIVQRTAVLIENTEWPTELQAQVDELSGRLAEFEAVLTAGDAEAVAPLAAEVHTLQHELSAEITAWLGLESEHEHSEGG